MGSYALYIKDDIGEVLHWQIRASKLETKVMHNPYTKLYSDKHMDKILLLG